MPWNSVCVFESFDFSQWVSMHFLCNISIAMIVTLGMKIQTIAKTHKRQLLTYSDTAEKHGQNRQEQHWSFHVALSVKCNPLAIEVLFEFLCYSSKSWYSSRFFNTFHMNWHWVQIYHFYSVVWIEDFFLYSIKNRSFLRSHILFSLYSLGWINFSYDFFE